MQFDAILDSIPTTPNLDLLKGKIQLKNTWDNNPDAKKQIEALATLLFRLTARIGAFMASEFCVDIADDSEVTEFLSPFYEVIKVAKNTVTAEILAEQLMARDQMQIDPMFREWYRVGDMAFGFLSGAYWLAESAAHCLAEGDAFGTVSLLAHAHEVFGRAHQEAYDRKYLGASAKHKAAKRHEGHYLIKEEAYRLAREKVPPSGQWQSRLSAARAIRPGVKAFAESIGKPLPGTDEAILKTIYMVWLPKMPEADVLFAGRRSTSSG